MPNLKDFISAIKTHNVSRAAHYYVQIGKPPFLNIDSGQLTMINLFCEATQLPEMVLSTVSSKVDGLNTEIVVDKSYGRLPCVFICDKDMTIKTFFDTWLNGIVQSRGGIFAYPSSYTIPQIKIYQLDTSFNEVYCVTIHDAYPRVVNDISLNYSSKDYNRVQVEFAYRYWTSSTIKTTISVPSGAPTEVKKFLTGMDPSNIPGVSAIQKIQTEVANQVARFPSFLKTVPDSFIDNSNMA